MQVIARNRLTGICLIAAFATFGLTSCGSGDYKSDNSSSSTDTGMTASSGDKTASDAMASDTTAAANAGTAAGPKKDNATAKKRGKMGITMPQGSSGLPVKDKEGVYSSAQVMPEFPGGQSALENYVNNNVDYPQQAIDNNTMGTLKVTFVVDEDGKVMNAHLMGGQRLGNGLDEEAVRVVNRMPAWKPGKVKGKNVKTRLELPISFQVEA